MKRTRIITFYGLCFQFSQFMDRINKKFPGFKVISKRMKNCKTFASFEVSL